MYYVKPLCKWYRALHRCKHREDTFNLQGYGEVLAACQTKLNIDENLKDVNGKLHLHLQTHSKITKIQQNFRSYHLPHSESEKFGAWLCRHLHY